MFFKKMLLSAALVVMSLPLIGWAQDDESLPLSVWSVGQIDPADHSVFYSILMTSGPEALTDVTVSALLPEGAEFIKDFWKPEAAAFVSEKDGLVTWTIEAIDADSVAGPFTFVASFADSDSEEFAPPASVNATLASSEGTVESPAADVENTLPLLIASGSLDISPEGFEDFTAVEKTGISLYTPESAVSEPITLSFERLPLDEDSLPETADKTWWCAEIGISANTDVSLAQPLFMTVPLLRAVTPGTIMPVFMQVDGGEWELISGPSSLTSEYGEGDILAPAFARATASATSAYLLLNTPQFSGKNVKFAIGVNVNIRATSVAGVIEQRVNEAIYMKVDGIVELGRP